MKTMKKIKPVVYTEVHSVLVLEKAILHIDVLIIYYKRKYYIAKGQFLL